MSIERTNGSCVFHRKSQDEGLRWALTVVYRHTFLSYVFNLMYMLFFFFSLVLKSRHYCKVCCLKSSVARCTGFTILDQSRTGQESCIQV